VTIIREYLEKPNGATTAIDTVLESFLLVFIYEDTSARGNSAEIRVQSRIGIPLSLLSPHATRSGLINLEYSIGY